MYCKHCGKEIDNDSKFCKECGQKTDVTVEQTEQNLKSDVPAKAPSKRRKIPKFLFYIVPIIVIGVIIIFIATKNGNNFLDLHDGMTHAQVRRILGHPIDESPKYDKFIVKDFFGYLATAEAYYDDEGLMEYIEATIFVDGPQSGKIVYKSLFESLCAEVGTPTFSDDPEEDEYPSATWYGLSTADYYKILSISYSRNKCTVEIGK